MIIMSSAPLPMSGPVRYLPWKTDHIGDIQDQSGSLHRVEGTGRQDAAAMPEMMSVFVLVGGDDFLLHVGVPRIEQLHAFLIDRLSRRR
jgi:hypothetical protein